MHTPHTEVGNLPIAILALTSFASYVVYFLHEEYVPDAVLN